MYARVCSCVCSERAPDRGLTSGQVSSSITPSYLFVVFLRKSLPLVLEIHWIANKPWDLPLCLPSTGIAGLPYYNQLYEVVTDGKSGPHVCKARTLLP